MLAHRHAERPLTLEGRRRPRLDGGHRFRGGSVSLSDVPPITPGAVHIATPPPAPVSTMCGPGLVALRRTACQPAVPTRAATSPSSSVAKAMTYGPLTAPRWSCSLTTSLAWHDHAGRAQGAWSSGTRSASARSAANPRTTQRSTRQHPTRRSPPPAGPQVDPDATCSSTGHRSFTAPTVARMRPRPTGARRGSCWISRRSSVSLHPSCVDPPAGGDRR